jgi:hypothetical protein
LRRAVGQQHALPERPHGRLRELGTLRG